MYTDWQFHLFVFTDTHYLFVFHDGQHELKLLYFGKKLVSSIRISAFMCHPDNHKKF